MDASFHAWQLAKKKNPKKTIYLQGTTVSVSRETINSSNTSVTFQSLVLP